MSVLTNAPVVVATHGHCFDGMASAALFTHLAQTLDPALAKAPFVYRGQTYETGKSAVDARAFEGARAGAILDFRYTQVEGLSWYFDHHASAFGTDADRLDFERLSKRERGFYDAAGSSCAKLISEVARDRFHVDMSRFADLIRWADMIDSANFPTPEMAVDRSDPEMKLLAVVEQVGDDRLLDDLVRRLLVRSLTEVARDRDLLERYAPIEAIHRENVLRIRAHEERRGPVVFVDLLDAPTETVTKFVTYADAPDAMYSVIASRTRKRCKVSVGYNPWCGKPRTLAIHTICERYGGGGHPVVGAVSLSPDIDACRAIALEIVAALGG